MHDAQDLIDTLALTPHPEGGWFRETWRATAARGERPSSTAIVFLLREGERSHWHKVDADEIWIWQGGDPLILHLAATDSSRPTTLQLSDQVLIGDKLQAVVSRGQWQAAERDSGPNGYTLVSCIVAPGFDFAGFTLAPQDWSPGA